jgi:ubiquinone/menaquinone biosynthesis C-methylase UbiE
MHEEKSTAHTYGLSRTPAETRRLQAQAQFINPCTQRLLEQAGVTTGMSVLDVGCGAGDGVLLLANMVGTGGTVVAVDIDPVIVDTARTRVEAAGFTNVSFLVGDIASIQLDLEFDAIIGRLILIHLPDPVSILHRLTDYVRPGGLIAFQETDAAHYATTSVHPRGQLALQVFTWLLEVSRHVGARERMGLDLYTVFLDAGLPAPQMSGEAMIIAGSDWIWYDWFAESVRSVLPLLLKFGLATEEEVDIATLASRLREEAISQRLVLRGLDLISAWTRKPELSSGE